MEIDGSNELEEFERRQIPTKESERENVAVQLSADAAQLRQNLRLLEMSVG